MWLRVKSFAEKCDYKYVSVNKMKTKDLSVMSGISIQAIHKKIQRAKNKIIQIDNNYFVFKYVNGIGRGGKVLQILPTPFATREEAEAFALSYARQDTEPILVSANKAAIKIDSALNNVYNAHNNINNDNLKIAASHIKPSSAIRKLSKSNSKKSQTPQNLTTSRMLSGGDNTKPQEDEEDDYLSWEVENKGRAKKETSSIREKASIDVCHESNINNENAQEPQAIKENISYNIQQKIAASYADYATFINGDTYDIRTTTYTNNAYATTLQAPHTDFSSEDNGYNIDKESSAKYLKGVSNFTTHTNFNSVANRDLRELETSNQVLAQSSHINLSVSNLAKHAAPNSEDFATHTALNSSDNSSPEKRYANFNNEYIDTEVQAKQNPYTNLSDVDTNAAGLQNSPYAKLSPFDTASNKARRIATEKKEIVLLWQKQKKKGIKAKDFVAYINLNLGGEWTLKLSENKLYAWQKAYIAQGINGLLDTRGYVKEGISCISKLGLDELLDKIISAQKARINISNVHEMLHIHLHHQGIHDIIDFKARNSEYVSYSAVARYVKLWIKNNPLEYLLIRKGEDRVIGDFKASIGKSNHEVDSINQVVEIDASPLDKVFDAKSLAKDLDIDISHIKSWQKRYVLISLVDTYSRVASFHISDTENSLGIARAVCKYILKYGKPKVIKGDNGKAFLSKYTQGVMENLGIEYRRVKPYSGWLKPYVENTFGALQDRVISWGKGYIGHNVSQRQAIEFFFSKKERRLKRGALTNLKELDSFQSMISEIDIYTDSILNNRYIDSLGCTPREAYNAKASEAIAMNEYELIMRLSPSIERKVNKKGIMYGGVWYSSTEIFNYDKVIIRSNINNVKEIFIYNKKGDFVDIAHCVGEHGVSAEEAKLSEKITLKRIRTAQKRLNSARDIQESSLKSLLKAAEASAPRIKAPKAPPINNIHIEAAKLRYFYFK